MTDVGLPRTAPLPPDRAHLRGSRRALTLLTWCALGLPACSGEAPASRGAPTAPDDVRAARPAARGELVGASLAGGPRVAREEAAAAAPAIPSEPRGAPASPEAEAPDAPREALDAASPAPEPTPTEAAVDTDGANGANGANAANAAGPTAGADAAEPAPTDAPAPTPAPAAAPDAPTADTADAGAPEVIPLTAELCATACSNALRVTLAELPETTAKTMRLELERSLMNECPTRCLERASLPSARCIATARTALELAACP